MAGGMLETPGREHVPKTVVLELSPSQETDATSMATPEHDMHQAEMSELAASIATDSLAATAELRPNPPSPETPAGKGPLYKCAICGEFVYESQLEHHVSVCPDPQESSPSSAQAAGDDQVATLGQQGQVPAESLQNEVCVDTLASEATQRMWKQWKDSELAAHHDAMVQRASMKRSQLLDELRRKEQEECTFQPKTLPRGSPRTYSRPDSTGEGKWIQRWDERMRNQRLKQVEAQHYAELTLKPKISPYAQAWSQKQTEVINEGQGLPSVFERLYHAALMQDEKKLAAMRDRDAASEQVDAVGASINASYRQSPTRRVPTSELLYSDALDRRERLRIMTEQLALRREEESKEKRAVLNRSRRYYWQMLERQIKAAFEATSKGQPLLAQAQLEDFLVGFKCMRPRKSSQDAPPTAEDSESIRLQAALWRHLDPNKAGHTDLLTLTVFFHVLMGAVDEAAQGASHSLVAPGAAEDFGMSPAKSSPSRLSPRSASEGGNAALQSIHEESGMEAGETALSRAGMQANMDSAAQDDEGRRIVELLLRFDPIRLRTEFQPLYSHRMHYQSQQEKKQVPKEEEPSVVNPAIDSQSRILAARLMQRERGESGKATHADILLWRHSQTEAKKQDKRTQRKNEEVSSCTFRPKCNRPSDNHVEVMTPAGATRAEVLYARGLAERERKEAKVLEGEKAKAGAEIRDCTFQPNTAKSVRSYQRAHDSHASVPRGFYESRQRLRAANEVREKAQQQKQDRLARIQPTSSQQAMLGTSVGTTASSSAFEAHNHGRDLRGAELCSSSGLPTVREDPPDRRRSTSPKHAWGSGPAANVRQRSAGHATARARQQQGSSQPWAHPAPARSSSQPPPSSMPPYGYPEESASHMGGFSSSREGSSHALPTVSESPSAGPPAGAPVLPPPRTAEAAALEEDEQEKDDKPPVLYVDVNIAPGQPPERIVLREGQSVSEVAAEFAAKHVLTPVLAQRLHALLREVVQRQELQAPQQ